MIFGVILAGGIGSRMGNVNKPKQFLHIGNRPIIIHTIEKFCINDKFKEVIVLCPEEWISYTEDLIRKYIPVSNRIKVIVGGTTRNDTIINAINYIDETYGLDDDTAVVTHDAVRPFVTHRIIEDNIRLAESGTPCDTVIGATDTIVECDDGETISFIPDRSKYYQGQTPQSFRAKDFRELFGSLSDQEKQMLTDAVKVFVMKGKKVSVVNGETFNIKVTYPYDLQLAETLLWREK